MKRTRRGYTGGVEGGRARDAKEKKVGDAFLEILLVEDVAGRGVSVGRVGGSHARCYEVEKVGGKDEINSRVYGTFKVAGISLTTWQPATVLAPAGGLKTIDGSAPETGPGYRSFSLQRTAGSVNDRTAELLRNFASTVRAAGKERSKVWASRTRNSTEICLRGTSGPWNAIHPNPSSVRYLTDVQSLEELAADDHRLVRSDTDDRGPVRRAVSEPWNPSWIIHGPGIRYRGPPDPCRPATAVDQLTLRETLKPT